MFELWRLGTFYPIQPRNKDLDHYQWLSPIDYLLRYLERLKTYSHACTLFQVRINRPRYCAPPTPRLPTYQNVRLPLV